MRQLSALPLDDPGWASFVAASPAATPFHHPAWAALVGGAYGYPAFALALQERDGRIVAGLPVVAVTNPVRGRSWLSLPFTDHSPPLGDGEALLDPLREQARRHRVGRVEVRGQLPHAPEQEHGVRHRLSLDADPDTLLAGMSAMHRRNLRRAQRAGVEIRSGTSDADMRLFYALHRATRRRLGVPVQPRAFFDRLRRVLEAHGMGAVLSAWVGDRPAAAALFLSWNRTLVYKYGASDERLWDCRPNNLLFWEAMRSGHERGDRELDFGRSDARQRGLREFKRGFGADEEVLKYSYLPSPPPPGRVRPVLERGAGVVIRRSPPAVGELVGKMLYRYAA